jgi:hypothetical protein
MGLAALGRRSTSRPARSQPRRSGRQQRSVPSQPVQERSAAGPRPGVSERIQDRSRVVPSVAVQDEPNACGREPLVDARNLHRGSRLEAPAAGRSRGARRFGGVRNRRGHRSQSPPAPPPSAGIRTRQLHRDGECRRLRDAVVARVVSVRTLRLRPEVSSEDERPELRASRPFRRRGPRPRFPEDRCHPRREPRRSRRPCG